MYYNKKPLNILISTMVAVITVVALSVVAYASDDIRLQLDGNIIETDVAPIIESDRTLVPYRALLESMGAEVHWENDASMATAVLGDQMVQVTINNTTAFVNGITKEMDVPPRIINSRTLIPLRFVLENLNCIVDWDNDTRTVKVFSPKEKAITEIEEIFYEETGECYRIIAKGNDTIRGTRTFSYNEPERYGIDIKGAKLPSKLGSISAANEVLKGIRFSQFDEDTVRIVVDLNEKVAGKLAYSEDKTILYIDFDKSGSIVQEENEDEVQEENEDHIGILPELDWRVSGKLVVIDVGHGGKDPGSSGKINGKTVINEKDLNLDVALRLHTLLELAGVNAVLLRDDDISMDLYSRPETANLMGADIFVSIHNNSAETPTPSGTEVLYYDKVGSDGYGITSKDLAIFIHSELIKNIGLKDRGIKNSPKLAVLNKSLMPAVIIEGGFLSNPNDLQVMLTESYKDSYAFGTAKGIIKALNYLALMD